MGVKAPSSTVIQVRTAPMRVLLASRGDRAIGADPRQPLGGRPADEWKVVEDWAAASAVCLDYIGVWDLDGATWAGGTLATDDGSVVGFVTQNGRVLPKDAHGRVGVEPLYDPLNDPRGRDFLARRYLDWMATSKECLTDARDRRDNAEYRRLATDRRNGSAYVVAHGLQRELQKLNPKAGAFVEKLARRSDAEIAVRAAAVLTPLRVILANRGDGQQAGENSEAPLRGRPVDQWVEVPDLAGASAACVTYMRECLLDDGNWAGGAVTNAEGHLLAFVGATGQVMLAPTAGRLVSSTSDGLVASAIDTVGSSVLYIPPRDTNRPFTQYEGWVRWQAGLLADELRDGRNYEGTIEQTIERFVCSVFHQYDVAYGKAEKDFRAAFADRHDGLSPEEFADQYGPEEEAEEDSAMEM